MKFSLISTWKMSYEGHLEAYRKLKNDKDLNHAILKGIMIVEDDQDIHSVGYGGLPAIDGQVYLDAAYMHGTTLRYGAVSTIKNIKNPIQVAYRLSERLLNCYLSGEGAQEYAISEGFEQRDMLSETAKAKWVSKSNESLHDTVCFIGKLDADLACGVSTSGLFMKEKGRVGDSCNIGSGFYVDSEVGGCAATGIGENIMRGCLSTSVVNLMRTGIDVQTACEQVISEHSERLKKLNITDDNISLIAIDACGKLGAATTKVAFPFVYSNQDQSPVIMVAFSDNGKIKIEKASTTWLAEYKGD